MKINCGERISEIRKSRGISQTELGKILGVSHNTISSWETNRTEPKMGQIEKMAQIFDCKKSDLIGSETPVFDSSHIKLIEMASTLSADKLDQLMNFAVFLSAEEHRQHHIDEQTRNQTYKGNQGHPDS